MLDISNYYEQLVIDKLWQLSADSDVPYTQSYLVDVACLALNRLPTCYVRNLIDKGASMSEHDHQETRILVDQAIAQAMQEVQQHPHDNRSL